MKRIERIDETSYLTADNFERYRAIMRIFYRAEESSKFELYKEDILDALHEQFDNFDDVDENKLKADLTQLVNWKNLIAVQDPKKVYTIAEYKNKQFRYSMSKVALEIERMMIRLENMPLESSTLSNHSFIRIEEALTHFPNSQINTMTLKEIHAWWKELDEDFRRLNEKNQDYIRQFYTGTSEKLMKSVEFIVHKDHFITYLKEYIQELQSHSDRIASLLERIDHDSEERFFASYLEAEMQIPRTEQIADEAEFRRQIEQKIRQTWRNIRRWFVGENGVSESMHIMDITNDIIHKIIQNAEMIMQMQNIGINRKAEYQKWIRLFQNCETLDDAHRLSVCFFGMQTTSHYVANDARQTDSIFSKSSEEQPFTYLLSSHSRTYRPKTEKSSYSMNALEKQQKKEEYLQRMRDNRNEVLKFIHGNVLKINEIQDVIAPEFRQALLTWIANANMNESKSARNEYGWKYQLEKTSEECVLHCQDGELVMPGYILKFEDIS